MNKNEPILCKIAFGYSRTEMFNKFENGRMITYSYRIDYDRDGKETGRTEPSILSSMGWGDGSPFTEVDYLILSETCKEK